MALPPRVVCLTLCDKIVVAGGELSLANLRHEFRLPQFPSLPQPFTVYTALADGSEEGTLQLRVLQLPSEQLIYRYRRWLAFPSEPRILNLEIRVRKCIFPAPGRYTVGLRFEDGILSQRWIDVRRGSPKASP